jgi:hypothetical protein
MEVVIFEWFVSESHIQNEMALGGLRSSAKKMYAYSLFWGGILRSAASLRRPMAFGPKKPQWRNLKKRKQV